MSEKLTIRLTGRAPVTIMTADWPIIARGDWHSGEHACQANEEAWLRVRQHKDGRTIVYGDRDQGPGGMPISYRGAYAGRLVKAGGSVEAAVVEVAEDIGTPHLAEDVLADLPAEELT